MESTLSHRGDGREGFERWEIDPERSRLTISIRHIVVHQIRGRFLRWGGTLVVNRQQPRLSSVDVWIELASISTEDTERDLHVCSAEFFDVARFPRAVFRSSEVTADGERFLVRGSLDLHGVVREVELTANAIGTIQAPDDRERIKYSARGTLNRQDFGLHWNQDLDMGGVVVGDMVDLVAEIEALRTDTAGAPRTSRSDAR
ncbi:MAG TPA: YceI family protein [Polyangia bacterium]|jgi:polyisoprenoid-binding protein YceI|nr:YceI family protein [Polyangia bacterium]